MYCSTCGVVVAQGLSYCKNCGAKLYQNDDADKSSGVKPDLLVRAMVTTFMFGLAMIAILMGVMKAVLDMQVGQILGVIMVPFLMMFILEGIFIKQLLFGHKKSSRETKDIEFAKQQATNELDPARAQALSDATPMPSVTEHTTRAFEPVYRDRKST